MFASSLCGTKERAWINEAAAAAASESLSSVRDTDGLSGHVSPRRPLRLAPARPAVSTHSTVFPTQYCYSKSPRLIRESKDRW